MIFERETRSFMVFMDYAPWQENLVMEFYGPYVMAVIMERIERLAAENGGRERRAELALRFRAWLESDGYWERFPDAPRPQSRS